MEFSFTLKVVAIFQEIVTFIQRCVSHTFDFSVEMKQGEPLHQAVSMALQEVIDKIKGGSDIESAEMLSLYNKIEDRASANISHRYGINRRLLKHMYTKETLRENLKENLKSCLFEKEKPRWEDCFSVINGNFKDFDSKAFEISESLSAIEFEINGVFRQVEYRIEAKGAEQKAKYPDSYISKQVQEKILRIQDVYGCGVILGKLVVHLEEYSHADIETVNREVTQILMESPGSACYTNHLEIKRIRLSPSASGTYESGQFIRVKNPHGHADPYTHGTLGCFVKRIDNNQVDSPGKLYALSCAHVFPEDCHQNVQISRAHPPCNWKNIGNFIPALKLLRGHKIDIAAIEVTVADKDCNHCLKNSASCDVWKSSLHEGDIRNILGFQVYKWGPVTNCTRGLIASVNYISHHFDSQLNVFIKRLDDANGNFSSEGDSGSAVCFDAPTDETVLVLSLVNGKMTVTTTEKQEFTYSVHLKKNLDTLSQQCGHSFELYNLDQ